MARSFNGTDQFLSNANAPVTAAPCSLAAWFYKTSDAATGVVFSIGDTAQISQISLVYDANEDVLATAFSTTASGSGISTGAGANNVWTHGAAVFRSTTSRDAYRDGGNKGSNGTAVTPASLDRMRIGLRANSNLNNPFPGYIQDVALWDIDLTDDEVASLAKGVSPLCVRPANLISYWPVLGRQDPEIDRVGGFNMSLDNSPPQVDHGRIHNLYRRVGGLLVPTAAPAPAPAPVLARLAAPMAFMGLGLTR